MTLAPPKLSATRGPRWFPVLVLLIATGLTLFASYYAYRAARVQAKANFEGATQDVVAAIRVRIGAYIALLRGGGAFVAAETNLNRATFQRYIDGLNVLANYPGIQGIGVTTRLAPEDIPEFLARVRSEGLTNYTIRPETPREEYHPITYLEPLDRRNLQAIGYDMFAEPVRRAAMERARDQGKPAASGCVKLVQEIDEVKQAGFLIYLAVYDGGEVPIWEEERRKKLRGFVYSPFRAGDLFDSILLPIPEVKSLRVEVFDGGTISTNVLYDSMAAANSREQSRWKAAARTALQQINELNIAEHQWTIRFTAQPGAFQANLVLSAAILPGGLLLSLLLFYMTWAEGRARREAEERTAELRASEQSLREARSKLEEYTRSLEQRVRERTAHLEQSLHSLEGVLYHVAHDLRAPLRAMASFTSILEEDYPERLDARGADYVRRIARGARRMDELVHDLLSYGRLGHVSMPLGRVDLDEKVQAVVGQFAGQIQQKQATVQVESPMPPVTAHPDFLQEVISHLLSNALKFVPDGIPPRVKIWAERGNGTVRLWVEDNGIGIQDKYHDRVFRIFERLHGQDAYSGTGIGLAIVSKTMERMGGRVGMESSLGHGSRFWIELAAA